MTDENKKKSKPLKQYVQEAQERMKKFNKPQQQKFNKSNNFRPQGRGR